MTSHLQTLLLLVFSPLLGTAPCQAGHFVAFSLKEAEHRLTSGEGNTASLTALGGITNLVGLVRDKQTDDIIVVGYAAENLQPIRLDDLVVAMRAVFLHKRAPLVSIDSNEATRTTGMQTVRFEGGIARTNFGLQMLEADIVLKKLAIGTLPGEVWGVPSYSLLTVQHIESQDDEDEVTSRFWFTSGSSVLGGRGDVYVIVSLDVDVDTEIIRATINGEKVTDLTDLHDPVGEQFAERMIRALDDLALEYRALLRVRPIVATVAVARGLEVLGTATELKFWLHEFPVAEVDTPTKYRLESVSRQVKRRDLKVTICGGLEVDPTVIRLESGDFEVFKEVVLASRPRHDSLCWCPPLEGWRVPGLPEMSLERPLAASSAGCSIHRILQQGAGSHATGQLPTSSEITPLQSSLPPIRIQRNTTTAGSASHIGGVMLSGTAQVEGARRVEACLTGGNFSLIVDGSNARLDRRLFRKFVTALWCVYYSDQDPGISIDPIGGKITPETKRHLVRYIGRVVNTDLARVMREADYLMKKWAVGTERPDYPGFEPVDGWMRHYGIRRSGVSRRFWFVPELLRFKRGGDLLLFDSGRMRLHTEYNDNGLRGQASPADEEFARFFTEHYDELAKRYPIYKELFEYAKLVALAKYLKEQGVPLHWFLLAHKDLVLTEDSPGTVDQLVRGSDYFRGMTIMGGVDLSPNSQYVYDQDAVAALREALAGHPAAATAPPRRKQRNVPVQPVSFETGRRSYTVLPQHTFTSGKDHYGNRYQTDFALRRGGRPALELVRYFDPRRRHSGQFGRGWHLLIPYRVRPADEKTRPFLNAVIPERMVVENLLSSRCEVLTFSVDRYPIAGYVPDKIESSKVIGLFLLSNGSFRMVDKLGNQFHFDPRGRMTAMFLSPSPEYRMQIEYLDQFTAAVVQPLYLVRPVGEERVDFLNARIPKWVRVIDCVNHYAELLTFDPDGNIPGYVPNDAKRSRFRMVMLLTNGGLQLLDKHGNQVRFTPGWSFHSALPPPRRSMLRSISMAGQKVTFQYTLDAQGQIVIAAATISEDHPNAEPMWFVQYEHDHEGRLCRVRRPTDVLASCQRKSTAELALAGR